MDLVFTLVFVVPLVFWSLVIIYLVAKDIQDNTEDK